MNEENVTNQERREYLCLDEMYEEDMEQMRKDAEESVRGCGCAFIMFVLLVAVVAACLYLLMQR